MKSFAMLLGAACMLASPVFAASGSAASVGTAVAESAATLAPSAWIWQDDGATGPLTVIVSLADQRAYVYRGDTMIAVSSVSTGRDGKETPTGIFPILQKQVHHRSTLYDSARMPYMERLTWDGIAIHAGGTPGYRTSHGCIHVPLAFAKKLYAATDIGTVVQITDSPIVTTEPPPAEAAPLYVETGQPAADANAAQLSTMGPSIGSD
jgi:lipoprotein-anchoring transpeptidase ErfK/SrfK